DHARDHPDGLQPGDDGDRRRRRDRGAARVPCRPRLRRAARPADQPALAAGRIRVLGRAASRYFGALTGRFQPASDTCLPRATVSWPAGAFFAIVEPPPMVAPSPSVTGATSTQLLPTCTSAPITVRCLF